jgi:hypothetical protein
MNHGSGFSGGGGLIGCSRKFYKMKMEREKEEEEQNSYIIKLENL